ncbi:location of vulva defective 1-like [Ahaetulla prasina]|uniref:location of vulva defective 1-like n=1 Tax=Ahaetulla prasina TaxID=499056 RepID=UPI00264736B7|nr:location of vulva defective 1-like [Ahaetulla prasina]
MMTSRIILSTMNSSSQTITSGTSTKTSEKVTARSERPTSALSSVATNIESTNVKATVTPALVTTSKIMVTPKKETTSTSSTSITTRSTVLSSTMVSSETTQQNTTTSGDKYPKWAFILLLCTTVTMSFLFLACLGCLVARCVKSASCVPEPENVYRSHVVLQSFRNLGYERNPQMPRDNNHEML